MSDIIKPKCIRKWLIVVGNSKTIETCVKEVHPRNEDCQINLWRAVKCKATPPEGTTITLRIQEIYDGTSPHDR